MLEYEYELDYGPRTLLVRIVYTYDPPEYCRVAAGDYVISGQLLIHSATVVEMSGWDSNGEAYCQTEFGTWERELNGLAFTAVDQAIDDWTELADRLVENAQ